MKRRAPAAFALVLIAMSLVSLACRRPVAADPPVATLAISRETTWITEPLRADGTPDYAEWITRKYARGITEGNNAAPAIMAVGTSTAPTPDEWKAALLKPWPDADAPAVAEWLRVNEASLDRVDEIVRTRKAYWIPPPDEMAMDAMIPSHLHFRTIVQALRARALQRAAVDDGGGARHDLLLGLRFADLVDRGPWLIDRLIGIGMRGIAAEPVIALANPPPSRHEDAAALLARLREVPASLPLDDVLEASERVQFLAGYADLYRAARRSPGAWEERVRSVLGAGDGLYEAIGQTPPPATLRRIPAWAIDWDELFRRINECWLQPACDAGFAAAARDLESRVLDRLVDEARTEPDARRRIARAFLTIQTPSGVILARVSWNEQLAIRRAGLVSAAAALWHVDHGRYPDGPSVLASGSGSAGFDPAADHADYAFRYAVTADGQRFGYTATPRHPGNNGPRAFCADSSGRLASTTDAAASTIVDGLCAPGMTTLVARTGTRKP